MHILLMNSCVLTAVRFNSAVKYASDRHFRDQVFCAQVPTATSFSETVVAVQNCTWRSYKSEVHFEPRHRPLHFQSTTIVYPKHTRNTYRTTLNYNGNRNAAGRRRFVSTVRLESTEDVSPCIIYTEDLWETHMRDVLSFPKFKNSLWLESYSESTWTKTLIQRRMLSEGHFVLLLPVTLVLDGGDELVLSVCLWSLHVFYVSVMYLCTSGDFFQSYQSGGGKSIWGKTVSAVCWFRGPQNSMKDLQIYTELKRMSVKNSKN